MTRIGRKLLTGLGTGLGSNGNPMGQESDGGEGDGRIIIATLKEANLHFI